MFGNGSFGGPFQKTLSAFPLNGRKGAYEHADKIILPESLLAELMAREIQYPMLFKLQVNDTKKSLYCGVSEFTASHNTVYIPQWMLTQLGLSPGQDVQLFNVMLQKGSFVVLRPHTYRFIEAHPDPKTLLEGHINKYATLTKGTTIQVCVGGKVWYLDVQDLKPARAVCIIDTDLKLEFDQPVDYADYEAKQKELMETRRLQDRFAANASEFAEQQLLSPQTPATVNIKSPGGYVPTTPLHSAIASGGGTPSVGPNNGVSIFANGSDDEDNTPTLAEKFGGGHSIKRGVQGVHPSAARTASTNNTSVVFGSGKPANTMNDGPVSTPDEENKRKRDELVRQQRAAMLANRGKPAAATTALNNSKNAQILGTNKELQGVVALNLPGEQKDDTLRQVEEGDWLIYYDVNNRPVKREQIKKSFAMTGVGNSIKRE